MSAAFPYLLGFGIGLLTGLYYFAGLWFTVKILPRSKSPNRLLALSAAARLLPTLAIMFILIRTDPGMFVLMLIAFFSVRLIMTGRIANREKISPTG
jgi:F1F0 ATPase subunit 2